MFFFRPKSSEIAGYLTLGPPDEYFFLVLIYVDAITLAVVYVHIITSSRNLPLPLVWSEMQENPKSALFFHLET